MNDDKGFSPILSMVVDSRPEGEYIGGTNFNNGLHGYYLTDEPIVRCRDCIFYDTVHLDCARQGWTDCDRNGFCS